MDVCLLKALADPTRARIVDLLAGRSYCMADGMASAKAAAKAGRHKGSAKRQRHAVEQRRPDPHHAGNDRIKYFSENFKIRFFLFLG